MAAVIRRGETRDIPALLALLATLKDADGRTYMECPAHTAGCLAAAMRSPESIVLVADVNGPSGLLWAAVGASVVSPDLIAHEIAWVCTAPGWGRRMARRYEQWAREKGAIAMRLNPRMGDERTSRLLALDGFAPVEIAWVKRF